MVFKIRETNLRARLQGNLYGKENFFRFETKRPQFRALQKKAKASISEGLGGTFRLLQKPDETLGGCVGLGEHGQTGFLNDA